MVGTSTVLANRESLLMAGGFDASLPSASDWDLWLKLAAMGKTLVINQRLCRYTQGRGNSISQDYRQRLSAMSDILNKYLRCVLSSPVLCLAGYSRLIAGYAGYYRLQRAYFRSSLLELLACVLQPAIIRLRFSISDLLRFGLMASTSLFSYLKPR